MVVGTDVVVVGADVVVVDVDVVAVGFCVVLGATKNSQWVYKTLGKTLIQHKYFCWSICSFSKFSWITK